MSGTETRGAVRTGDPAERVIACMLAMQRYPWEQGVCAQALYEAGREEYWLPMAHDAVKRQAPDGRLAMIGGEIAVSDPASAGEVCLRAWEKTGDGFYLEGARRMLAYLLREAPRTADGVICHNLVSFEEGYSPRQLWIDGLYMVPPFLAVMGETEEAAAQARGYARHLLDGETNVFFHIVDAEQGRFVRKKRWATGNGWALMGLMRVAEAAREQGNDAVCREMTALYRRVLDGVLAWQLPDGRFRDILDEEDSFIDGTSAAMTAASVFRGITAGLLPETYREAAERAYRGVLAHVDDMGLVRGVCGCPDFLREGTSAEAQAAFVMAHAWRERSAD